MSKYTIYKSVFGNYSHAESLMPLMLHNIVEVIRGGILQNDILRNITSCLLHSKSLKKNISYDIYGKGIRCIPYNVSCHNIFCIFPRGKQYLCFFILLHTGNPEPSDEERERYAPFCTLKSNYPK